jgi:hypothetical protein
MNKQMVVLLVVPALVLAACGPGPVPTAGEIKPARVEQLPGTSLTRVILTAQAARRLDIQLAPVRSVPVKGAQRRVIPYAAILYDSQGAAWTYTNPEPLSFERRPIDIDYIEGDLAVLKDGPPTGMAVVTVGAAELFGVELGVGE